MGAGVHAYAHLYRRGRSKRKTVFSQVRKIIKEAGDRKYLADSRS